MDFRALSKVQAVIIVAVIAIAGVASGFAYIFWKGSEAPIEVIRIGICCDLDNVNGKAVWQGAVLAAEQVNAAGGVLGRDFELVAEDDDSETPPFDIVVATNALTKLISVHKVDFVLSRAGGDVSIVLQGISANHEMIFFSQAMQDELAQQVADDYKRYKGFFRVGPGNLSSAVNGMTDCVLTLRNYTGFSKVAYLTADYPVSRGIASGMADSLQERGFDIVYEGIFPPETVDFSSYFAGAEASGAEILVPFVYGPLNIAFIKEYYNRQSPFILWGDVNMAQEMDFWDITEGMCESVSFVGYPVISGYPLTSKTVPTREAYIERWGEIPNLSATSAYDLVRFILPDAINRAGTIETEAMIAALETTNVETSLARHWVFTSSHDVMVGEAGPNRPAEDYLLVCLFQWQNGKQVPVYPKEIMDEAEATYIFPDWEGPWSK